MLASLFPCFASPDKGVSAARGKATSAKGNPAKAAAASAGMTAPECIVPLRHAKLIVKQGDITRETTDAIVNAANERMLGGGGVDGAIHRAAGPGLFRACAEYPEVEPGVRCPTGEARITGGFNLPARHVIHTVGPIYHNDRVSAPLLAGAYRSSLKLALENGLTSISFPGISTGVFGYPYDKAAQVSMAAVDEVLAEAGAEGSLREVYFVMFGRELFDVFAAAAQRISAAAAAEVAAREGTPGPAAAEEAAPAAARGGTPQPEAAEAEAAAEEAAPVEAAASPEQVELAEPASVPQPAPEPAAEKAEQAAEKADL